MFGEREGAEPRRLDRWTRPAGGEPEMADSRLSALDASFLDVETPTAHMHVGWTATFARPVDGRACDFEALRDHIVARLDRAPRYRQRLADVPLDVDGPVWVD